MTYTFSWGWFLIGFIVLLGSGALTAWYRPVADNFGSGPASYDRFRLWGVIGCGIGFILMLNLHTLILTAIFSQFFGRSN